MSIDTFKKAGIYLRYCRFAVVPEIPYAQDVLYALRLSEEEKCYTFCVCNHATYVVNVGLIIAAVGYDVLCMERYDEAKARKIIAQAILSLTADEDKCLFNLALAEATETVTGQPAPYRLKRDATLAMCECASCKERKAPLDPFDDGSEIEGRGFDLYD
ncbi:hypothetical protein KJZ71_04450 [Patescibacteria group bacterium]|uniref:Uncharacterized protein n=1 Tax=candidate division WWE3 bacterium TaxID=2053526 RepID=A0A928TV13_UNCKA|nr:hypothetical protein [candidate division WWE3 bacterium]MCL4733022.1 hypothetical protein [Patescibacteria group bacterium]MDL1953295.1 hypothetical protein [Candidatus Uhrbacteria bacterium UHB]RIL00524.1 MAG: hypothetical protein DCC77_03100 [Candidatus Uhrbacteria bacterium]